MGVDEQFEDDVYSDSYPVLKYSRLSAWIAGFGRQDGVGAVQEAGDKRYAPTEA